MKHKCKHYTPHLDTIREYISCLYSLEGCGTGGMLHILLDDDNFSDYWITDCLKECLNHPEKEEWEIGKLICENYLKLSMPQRRLMTTPYITCDFDCIVDCKKCEDCIIEKGFATEH
jgi:hypothetical protein